MGEMTTPETRASLVARLKALETILQTEPGGDEKTAKLVFDLREASRLLEGLDALLDTILAEEAQEDPSDTLGKLIGLAGGMRDRFDSANPEPKVV